MIAGMRRNWSARNKVGHARTHLACPAMRRFDAWANGHEGTVVIAHTGENDSPPPEVLIGALTVMIRAASHARDECHDDLRRSWHQGRVSAFMDAKRETESWVASVRWKVGQS